jgi:hypothetical protein
MKSIPLSIIFFNVAGTLVRKISASFSGVRFGWVAGAKNLFEWLQRADHSLGLISNTGDIKRT